MTVAHAVAVTVVLAETIRSNFIRNTTIEPTGITGRLIKLKSTMKRTIILTVTSLVAAVACGSQPTTQEKIDAYNAACEALISDFNAKAESLEGDALEQASIEVEKAYSELGLNTIKKNPNDSVALVAFKNLMYMLEADELEEAVNALGEQFQDNKTVKRIKDGLAAKKATVEGKMFTDFTIDHVSSTDANGEPVYTKVKLSDYVGKGKYILVDFWSPWCPPCKKEIPNIKAVYEKYHSDKFDVLSVAVWEESRGMNWKNTIDTAKVLGITWNQINNGHQEPADLYGIDGIPHVILFGPDGTIVKRGLRGEALEEAVKAAVAE